MDTAARNTLIRRLRGLGWSLRAIAGHEEVGVSAEMVRKVLRAGPPVELADDAEPVTLESPTPRGDQPPVAPVEYVGVDETGSYALFVDNMGRMTTTLALWRRMFEPPPVGGPGGWPRPGWPTPRPRPPRTGPDESNCGPIGTILADSARCGRTASKYENRCLLTHPTLPIRAAKSTRRRQS